MIMGRRTWDSIGRPLGAAQHRRDPRSRARDRGATVVHSFEEAVRAAGGVAEISVIGGADIFAQALPMARVIELTRVHARVPADTFFPSIDPDAWRETHRERHSADATHAYPFSFVTLERVTDQPAPAVDQPG
jgi:dihydrofolate reductase